MKSLEIEEKLTAAAKQALDELVEDYKNRLLIGAKESASSLTGEVQEISVHDILSSVNRNQAKRISSLPRNTEMILILYIVGGLVIGGFGIFFLLSRYVLKTLELEQLIAVIISLTGFTISAMSYLYIRFRQSRVTIQPISQDPGDSLRPSYSMSFINRWQEVELFLRSLVASRLGESSAKEPFSILIRKLRQENVLNAEDEIRLKEFLSLRNRALHQGLEINREQYELFTREINRINDKMTSSS